MTKLLTKFLAWLISRFMKKNSNTEVANFLETLSVMFRPRQTKPHPPHNNRKFTRGRKFRTQRIETPAGTRIIYHEQPTQLDRDRARRKNAITAPINEPTPE